VGCGLFLGALVACFLPFSGLLLPLLAIAGIVGLLMMLGGGAKRVCGRCGHSDLVPPDSLRGKRILDATAHERLPPAGFECVCTNCGTTQPWAAQCLSCSHQQVVRRGSEAALKAGFRE